MISTKAVDNIVGSLWVNA